LFVYIVKKVILSKRKSTIAINTIDPMGRVELKKGNKPPTWLRSLPKILHIE